MVHPKLASVYEERYGFTRTGMGMKYSSEDPSETEIGYIRLGVQGLLDLLYSNVTWRAKKTIEGQRKNRKRQIAIYGQL